jgi:thiol-disulfide isomerase/thioredoxin
MSAKILVLIVVILVTATGIVAIYQDKPASVPNSMAAAITQPSATSTSTNPVGFSFNPLDEPRTLPEVRFKDANGYALTLDKFRGKVVLLNIWATWCVPCRLEMPALDRLQKKLGGRDFQVVAVSIDVGIPEIVEFFDELNLEHLQIYADTDIRLPMDLEAFGIPATLLIDRTGREIGRIIGPVEWDSDEVIAKILHYVNVS